MKINIFTDDIEKRNLMKMCFFLWIACVIGSLAVFPYIYYLGIFPPGVSLLKVMSLSVAQNAILFGIACYLSYLFLPKTDLQPFSFSKPLKRVVYPGIISGVAVSLLIFLLEKFLFFSPPITIIHPPFWTGILAAIYGSVDEEVLLRLFLFTLIYYLFRKVFKASASNRLTFLWITNIIVALMFGIGHLPAALQIAPASFFVIFRVLFLNGLAGIVFGWLYFSRSLWAAMLSHFVADLMLHVVLI